VIVSFDKFQFNDSNSVAKWEDSGVDIVISNLKQASCDSERNFVAALPKDGSKRVLNIFDKSGLLLFSLFPPADFLFEYLLNDSSHGVRVVCSGMNERGDTLDWYFKIDFPSRELVKQGRAY
jgi:hypothetical protein